jgi:Ni,Fe-hydrogenase I small subunit
VAAFRGDPSNPQPDPTGNAKLSEVDILWLTAGLGCDGDTIAMTGAMQPSIEDIVTGALPWIPRVRFYNPFLAYENGDDFVRPFREAAEGKSNKPFILIVEGSIPNEKNKSEGYWASFGTDSLTGQPILTCDWIDRLAEKAWAIIATGTCATYGGIHAMEGNPTGSMGLPDYLGWDWKSKAGIPIVCVPGCPVQPDNMMETILYLFIYGGRPGSYDSARRCPTADLAVWEHRSRGLRPRRLLRAGGVCRRLWVSSLHRKARMLGASRPMQRGEARLDGRYWRMPQRRRNLHRVHDAGLSG